jgi:hypothetical protein
MKNAIRAVGRALGWEENPANVFWLAIPLAAAGFGLTLWEAILRDKALGGHVFLCEWFGAVALLVFALIPAWRMHRATRRALRAVRAR